MDISGQPITTNKTKIVVITGCDHGFGHLLSKQLSDKSSINNTIVVALCLTSEAAKELTNYHPSLFGIQCDVTQEGDISRAAKTIESLLNEHQAYLHTLVNNAGIANPGCFLFYTSTKPMEQVMQVNYFGMLKVTQSLLPLMLRTSENYGGRILNMSSVCGTVSSSGNSAYNASKFAVEAWSDSLRIELANPPFNISVVKIRPGAFSTNIQNEWAEGYEKNFRKAPASVQQFYGGENYENFMEMVLAPMKTKNSQQADPQHVVDSLEEIILKKDLNQLEPHYWLGNDAQTFWKALSVLPTAVSDAVKATLYIKPVPTEKDLPALPSNNVSHVTIRVTKIEKSLSFYKAFGFVPVGNVVNGQQFLWLNSSTKTKNPDWSPLVLLKEDPDMVTPRGASYEAGMTRLSMYTTNLQKEVQRLESLGFTPIAPAAIDKTGGIMLTAEVVAFKDPDGFVLYLAQFHGFVGQMVKFQQWKLQRTTPSLFHWTINVTSGIYELMSAFEKLGFQTLSDQNSDQVINDLLPAFNMDPDTTKIEHIRLCLQKNDCICATLMQWTNPKTEKKGWERTNAMTIAVDDVQKALDIAKKAGLETSEARYRELPIYGNVLIGEAYVEHGGAPIEFCCFQNRRL